MTHTLLTLARPVHRKLAAAIITGMTGAALGVLSALALAETMRELFAEVPSTPRLALALTLALGAVLARFGLKTWAFRLSHLASFELEVSLRRALAVHVSQMPLGEVQRLGSGAIKKIVQDDVRHLHAAVADATPLVGVAIGAPLVAVIALLWTDVWLTLAVLAPLPLVFAGMRLSLRDYSAQRRTYDEAHEAVNTAVIELVQGMDVVRTFDDGEGALDRFRSRVRAFSRALHDWNDATRSAALFTRTFTAPLPTLLVLAIVATSLILRGSLDVPDLLVFLCIGTSVVEAIAPMHWLTHYINESKAAASRITELLNAPRLPEPTESRHPRDASVCFRDVRFSYDSGSSTPALDGLDLEIPAGSSCALVGLSGAGKSTVARLVARFWDVQRGVVEVGGVDVREIPSEVLLRHVAMVFQDPVLLHDTIRSNIRMGRPDATDGEVERAATMARAHEFIVRELPQGYDTVVGERGASLSGGQRQRITIARAILADAPIIVLDEATSFADPENEALLQEAMADLVRGKTLIVIAHRLSTITTVDQIIVLDRGRAVERGTHDELLTLRGRYWTLFGHHERASRFRLERAPRERGVE